MTFGANIRNLRLKHKLSIRALSRAVSTSPSTISNLEKDKHEPGVYLAADIAEVLGTTVDKLL